MESRCYICKNTFNDSDALFIHLKCVHSLTSTSIYCCGVPNCPQTFTSFRSFAKHMKSNICNTNPIQPIIINEKHGTNKNNVSLPNINPNDQMEEIEQNYNNFNLDTLKCSMIKFLLHYYGKLNFSRKDALQLQRDVTKMIMFPIAQQIKNLLKINETIDNNTKKSLELIINLLNNPFEDFESEYKFLKYLTNNDYYDKPKIICLDNSIDNIINHNTNMIAEKKTKCVILPLKFQLRGRHTTRNSVVKTVSRGTTFLAS